DLETSSHPLYVASREVSLLGARPGRERIVRARAGDATACAVRDCAERPQVGCGYRGGVDDDAARACGALEGDHAAESEHRPLVSGRVERLGARGDVHVIEREG